MSRGFVLPHSHCSWQRVVVCQCSCLGMLQSSMILLSHKVVLFKPFIYEQFPFKKSVEIPNTEEWRDLPFLLLHWQIDFNAEEGKRFRYEYLCLIVKHHSPFPKLQILLTWLLSSEKRISSNLNPLLFLHGATMRRLLSLRKYKINTHYWIHWNHIQDNYIPLCPVGFSSVLVQGGLTMKTQSHYISVNLYIS